MNANIDAQELNGLDGWFSQIFTPNADERDKYIKELNEIHQPMLNALQAEYKQKADVLVAQANTDKANFNTEKASLEAQITQKRKEKEDRAAAAQAAAQAQAQNQGMQLAQSQADSIKAKNTPTTEGTPEVKKDNTMLYVAVAGGTLVLTAIGVWVFMSNKKPAKTVNGTPRKRK